MRTSAVPSPMRISGRKYSFAGAARYMASSRRKCSLRLVMPRNLYILALLATVACDGKPVQVPVRTPTLVDSADQVMFNGKTTITANGVRRGEISGDTVATFDQLTRFTFIKMQVQ